MLPIQRKISPYNHGNNNNKVKYIVLHDVGALGQALANANYFYTQNRGSSAHLFVDDNSIWQSVEFYDSAWHVGDDKPGDSHDVGDLIHNKNSIGVEMCLDKNWKVTDKTKKNTIELVQYLLKLYPNAQVVRHHDASGKMCPRSMSANNWSEWKAFKAQISASKSVHVPIKVNAPNTIKVAKNDTLWGLSKQYNASVAELKEWNNLKSDVITVGQVLQLKKPAAPVKATPKPVAKAKIVLPTGVFSKKRNSKAYSKDVLTIQKALSSVYFYPNKAAKNHGCDGYFGGDTEGALKRFQSVHGLTVDGVYGAATRKKLASLLNK